MKSFTCRLGQDAFDCMREHFGTEARMGHWGSPTEELTSMGFVKVGEVVVRTNDPGWAVFMPAK